MTAGSWTRPAYEAVARLVSTRTGLAFAPSRRDEVEAGIRRAMATSQVPGVERYLEHLTAGAIDLDDLIAELTVGETYFFRDPSHFELIRREVLPDVLRRHGPGHVLRVWSAGCSSGEEAYSLAILLDQLGLGERARIHGSDIARQALARAGQAVYRKWSLRGVDAAIVQRYFRPVGDLHALDDRIKERVSFGALNLALDTYPSPSSGIEAMDIILCRNVLIYFDPETVKRVAERLYRTLAPAGWLVTGPSDPSLSGHAPFETVVTRDGVFYRRGAPGRRVFDIAGVPCLISTAAPGAAQVTAPVTAAVTAPEAAAPSPPHAAPQAPAAALVQARAALAAGDYDRALALVAGLSDATAAEISVRARANRDGCEAAADLAARAARQHPLHAPLHFLHAMLLLDLGRPGDAVQAIRRALYLDRFLAMAHFVLGTLLARLGDRAGARRAYETAAALAAERPPDEPVPLGDGERAGRLARVATTQAGLLETR